MNFDFSERYQVAFGTSAGQLMHLATSAGQDALVHRHHHTQYQAELYGADADESIDYLTLWADGVGEYHFAFGEFAEGYSHVFAPPPMIDLKREKRVVITTLDNADAEVIERYTTSPYIITLRGLLVDTDNHTFPLDKLESINSIFEANKVWNASSRILGAVDVLAMVITGVDISFVEGFEDTVAYQINARATKSIEYQLIQM